MSPQAPDGTAASSPLAQMEAPLTAAGNFLAGVTARAHGLAAGDSAPAEAHERLLTGIEEAIAQLQRAAGIARSMVEAAQTLPSAGPAGQATAH